MEEFINGIGRDRLMEVLGECHRQSYHDEQSARYRADAAIVSYLGDGEVTEAYRSVIGEFA